MLEETKGTRQLRPARLQMALPMVHEHLLAVCLHLPQDYAPWGYENRDEPEFGPDCSSGCKYYAQLEGKLGMDWGVCVNPLSHRCGLLTFEHQGCRKFEVDPDLDAKIEKQQQEWEAFRAAQQARKQIEGEVPGDGSGGDQQVGSGNP